jgi:hypothetical protein
MPGPTTLGEADSLNPFPNDARQYSAAAERNGQRILQGLQTRLPAQGLVLEIERSARNGNFTSPM